MAKRRTKSAVLKNVNVVRCATHKDRKKAMKKGDRKHKGRPYSYAA